jgi:hypothetical protein
MGTAEVAEKSPPPAFAPDRELLGAEELKLCLADGRLNHQALGWSRRPMHRANLQGPWLRQKRWDAWGVGDDRWFLMLGVMNLDYISLAMAVLYDRQKKILRAQGARHLLGRGCEHSSTTEGDCRFSHSKLMTVIVSNGNATQLSLTCPDLEGESFSADVEISRPPGHESMNLVIPWSDRRYHFTSKQACMPTVGQFSLGGRTIPLGDQATAWLDFARGVWPYSSGWNWAMCSGKPGGRLVGFNLGAGWTDGTGVNENALYIDGRVVKIPDEVEFDYSSADPSKPWRIRSKSSDQVDLTFSPIAQRCEKMNLLIVRGSLLQEYGRFDGKVRTDRGETVLIEGLFGVTEEHRSRW